MSLHQPPQSSRHPVGEAGPSWQVLLIGGSSGVGKSTVAQELARQLGISHLLVDDLRIAIQEVTSPDQFPALHYFLAQADAAALNAEAFVAGLIGVSRALTPALRAVISHHIAVPAVGRIILEGDSMLPEFVCDPALTDVHGQPLADAETKVRSVFICEADEAQLLNNFVIRWHGSVQTPSTEQRRYVHSIWHYGQWIQTEAERYGLPVVPAQPFGTLAKRILAAVR